MFQPRLVKQECDTSNYSDESKYINIYFSKKSHLIVFDLFYSDLIRSNRYELRVSIDDIEIFILAFADDLVIIVQK